MIELHSFKISSFVPIQLDKKTNGPKIEKHPLKCLLREGKFQTETSYLSTFSSHLIGFFDLFHQNNQSDCFKNNESKNVVRDEVSV